MRGLEVHLNGNRLCTAGIGVDGVLNTIVDVVGRQGVHDITIRVGGLENNKFLTWAQRALHVGDEVRIRIVEVEVIDVPVKRMPIAS